MRLFPVRSSSLKTILTFTLLAFSANSFANDGLPPEMRKKVDAVFAEWDKTNSPGCALAIIQDGKIVYKRGYGMANLEHGVPISSKSVFRIASVSKQITAACMALLQEQGKLNVDDDARKYLPELPDYGSTITIRRFITHTSGVRDYLTLLRLAGYRRGDFVVDEEIYDLIVAQKALNFDPGEEFLYSNSGYFLLAEIVKRVSGQTLREFAAEQIFQPLGMNDTHFHNDQNMIVRRRADGYAQKQDGGYEISMTSLEMIGDGGVFTTVEDLAKWDANFYDNKLGKGGKDFVETMLTTAVLNNGEKLEYAFGLSVGDYKGLRTVRHGGSFVGFRADMVRFPEQRFSVICLANLSSISPSSLTNKVADICLENEFQAKKKTALTAAEAPQAFEADKEALRAFIGVFEDKRQGNLWRIEYDSGKLMMRMGRNVEFELTPIRENAFKPAKQSVPGEIVFGKFANGQPREMRLIREGNEPIVCESVQLASPAPGDLSIYAGAYFSEELGATYQVVFRDGALYLEHENPHKGFAKDEALNPTLKDQFEVSSAKIRFTRNRQGQVAGFVLDAGRVKNIQFVSN